MGNRRSKHDKQSSQNEEQISVGHILELLSDLNSKCKEIGGDCTSSETRAVNTKQLHRSLEKYKDTPEFKKYQIAETIKNLAPLSVTKRWNKSTGSLINSTAYYDYYGAEPGGSKHKKITTIITGHVAGNSDIVNIIFEYRGSETFLFTAETVINEEGKTISSCLSYFTDDFGCSVFENIQNI